MHAYQMSNVERTTKKKLKIKKLEVSKQGCKQKKIGKKKNKEMLGNS